MRRALRRPLPLFFAAVCIALLWSCHHTAAMPTEPAGDFIVVNGKKLWYRIEGDGPPLLVIPGGPGASHAYLWPHLSRLAKNFKIIWFDAYGRGKSERAKNPTEYTFVREVEEVEGLRQALHLGKTNIYGHSYGGMVAQAYALKYPASVDRLILADTFHSGAMLQSANDNWNFELQNQMPELWDRLQKLRAEKHLSCDPQYQKAEGEIPVSLLYYYDPSNANDPSYGSFDVNLDVYCQLAGPDADVVLGGDLARLDFRSRLKKLTMPTLVLTGRFDRVATPRLAIQFKQFIPQATFVMFERSGHNPFLEEPAKHEAVVKAFLGGH